MTPVNGGISESQLRIPQETKLDQNTDDLDTHPFSSIDKETNAKASLVIRGDCEEETVETATAVAHGKKASPASFGSRRCVSESFS